MVLPFNDKFAKLKNLFRIINANLVFSFKNNFKNILINNALKIKHLAYIKLHVIIVVSFITDKLLKHYLQEFINIKITLETQKRIVKFFTIIMNITI